MNEWKPEAVVHLAALPSAKEATLYPTEALQINVDGTLSVLEGVKACGSVKRFIFTSSSFVYGHFKRDVADEEHPTDPIDVYGGTMGVERLSDYDVEIDNVTKTVTLWRSDKFCAGRLVRWAEKWVEIPYSFNNEIIETKVKVGDERIKATFDTGSTSPEGARVRPLTR